ncbi:MAG: hypothetical protein HFG00_01050 [Oscillibacter sp.]|nr:hypothetical protein [Oscillibacter sp.]
MTNRYRNLLNTIPVPAGLNDRVLQEARRRLASGVSEKPAVRPLPALASQKTPGRTAARSRRSPSRPFLRTAVCAVCALALLLGGISLRRAPEVPEVPAPGPETVLPIVPTFGLTAYAAGTDSSYGPAEDGGIAFAAGEGMTNPGEGDFTGCLFQVTGTQIAQVRLSIDRGKLYRYRLLDNLTEEELQDCRQAMAEGRMTTAAISQREDGSWYVPEMTLLGQEVTEPYDPDSRYGFWVSPEDMAFNTGLGLTTEAQMDADYFDGARLTVAVVSPDGTEQIRTYRLHSGALKIQWTEDHDLTVLPELAGPEEPFVYGIYALPEDGEA